ncbi:unnamed protein product [Calicophoron daubneyi]|uniref:Uncharacterized protein n=1 Tax=Calicophoron daubneyi TaxID=300641 RepID=A0AAV2TXC9_CALDB
MTSRLDRLFTLLENCPNVSLRTAAAEQLGELVHSLPTNLDSILSRLAPLLRSRSWVSRVAAADVIRSIVRHLPTWEPSLSSSLDIGKEDSTTEDVANPGRKKSNSGFLSLCDLRLDRVLAQGARLYSMDARELEKSNPRSRTGPGTNSRAQGIVDFPKENDPTASPFVVQRHELNSRLGLDDDSLLSSVLATHANVSVNSWIAPEDLDDTANGILDASLHLDVETCIRSTFDASFGLSKGKRVTSECPVFQGVTPAKQSRTDIKEEQKVHAEFAPAEASTWPLDNFCTMLLGDLWDVRWETRHGAASGLRELLSEPRLTKQAGKRSGMTKSQTQDAHSSYLEDIAVRVLCTLALDQLSDFISDEVVAPVRETAAQLLGVLSRHLSTEQVLQVVKHLIHLVSLDLENPAEQSNSVATNSSGVNAWPGVGQLNCPSWKNNWMIVHGGLLGIKYLLASRKDLHAVLLPSITPCLVGQLIGTTAVKTEEPLSSTTSPSLGSSLHNVADDDIRAAAASALIPVVDPVWLSSLGAESALALTNRIWTLLRDITTDLSPSAVPLLQLVCRLITAESELASVKVEQGNRIKLESETQPLSASVDIERIMPQVVITCRLLHHASSGIRQHALDTLQCLFETCRKQLPEIPAAILRLIIDQLFHRIILEPTASVRTLATKLCISIVEISNLNILGIACIDRLDFWLCQAMQPTGVPFPTHLLNLPEGLFSVPNQNSALSASPNVPVTLPSATTNPGNTTNGCGPPASIGALATTPDYRFCIGGSHCVPETECQLEAFVLETRICAVRVLARLFARLCHSKQTEPQPCVTSNPGDIGPVQTSTSTNVVLAYFLDQLLCRLHFTERLAMQRFIGGLLLAAWATLPSSIEQYAKTTDSSLPKELVRPETWASRLAGPPISNGQVHLASSDNSVTGLCVLAQQVRAKLEACLTEVIYYEEILGLFKLMQEDTRELILLARSCGLPDDPSFSFSGVRTIAQSSTLIQKISQAIANPSTPANINSAAFPGLAYALDKAHATVERCLALQLYLGSRVEFAIATAFTSLGWTLSGRLSILIRPLMDTIRCIHPSSPNLNPQTTTTVLGNTGNAKMTTGSLLPTGDCVQFQQLASVCLARLLRLDWSLAIEKANTPELREQTCQRNPSRAAMKVVKNLAVSLLASDSQFSQSSDESPETGQSADNNPAVASEENDKNTSSLKEVSAEVPFPVVNSANQSNRRWQEAQNRGARMALVSLCRAFLTAERQPDSKTDQKTEHRSHGLADLEAGLPGLWDIFWTQPVAKVLAIVNEGIRSGDRMTLSVKEPFRRKFSAEIFENIPKTLAKPEEDAICVGLLTLSTCLPVILPCLSETGAADPPITFEQLVSLGFISSCSRSNKIRMMGARVLAVLATERPVQLLNMLLPLQLPCLDRTAPSADHRPLSCIGTLEALSHIVERVTNFSATDHSSALQPINDSDPLADPVRESQADNLIGADNSTDSSRNRSKLSPALCSFLPFVVLLVPPVLRLLADPDAQIRGLAGQLFGALLNLFPFENSLPDPPGMDPIFSAARSEKRQFIDSLLHPEHIKTYNLPIPIRARLRGYQQEGVNWLSFLNRYGLNGILCDDLGLGKTLQTICIIAGSHYEKQQLQQQQQQMKQSPPVDSSKPKKRRKENPLDGGCESSQSVQTISSGFSSLVVCPSTLCGHWLHEVKQFVQPEHLQPVIYSGGPAARQSLQTNISQFSLVIASYDIVRIDISFFQSILWNYVVLDEGHIIKSSKSKVARALKQLRARHRLILTGTPIQNRVCELWSLFDFLMPDFLGTEATFASRFARPVAASRDPKASKADQRSGHLALEKLHRLVLPFMLRRLKEDVMADLPPKIVQDFACEMTSIQVKLYEAFTKSSEGQKLLDTIKSRSVGMNSPVSSGTASHCGFQALRYLQAVCNHPCLALKPGHPMTSEIRHAAQMEFGPNIPMDSVHLSGKLLALCRLLTDCGFGTPNLTLPSANQPSLSSITSGSSSSELEEIGRNLLSQHRALIFFRTRDMLQLTEKMLRLQFPWITSTRLDGSVPVNERHNRVTKFNEDPSIDVMLLTTTVGGLGLNLTGADTVIFVEHDWNPSRDLQAMDRVHRIGQRRTVNVYRLITQDSVEEQIMNLQAFKLHLASVVVSTDNRNLADMDTEHLFDRFNSMQDQQRGTRRPTDDNPSYAELDDMEACYENEYNLDAFVAKLNSP